MRRMTTISTFAITSHKGKCSSTTRLIKYCDKRLFKILENVEISFLLICLFHESKRNFTIYGCSSSGPNDLDDFLENNDNSTTLSPGIHKSINCLIYDQMKWCLERPSKQIVKMLMICGLAALFMSVFSISWDFEGFVNAVFDRAAQQWWQNYHQ